MGNFMEWNRIFPRWMFLKPKTKGESKLEFQLAAILIREKILLVLVLMVVFKFGM
jgi:hypothetical protein